MLVEGDPLAFINIEHLSCGLRLLLGCGCNRSTAELSVSPDPCLKAWRTLGQLVCRLRSRSTLCFRCGVACAHSVARCCKGWLRSFLRVARRVSLTAGGASRLVLLLQPRLRDDGPNRSTAWRAEEPRPHPPGLEAHCSGSQSLPSPRLGPPLPQRSSTCVRSRRGVGHRLAPPPPRPTVCSGRSPAESRP